jgi:PAS domain S-box-containing protein
MNYSEYPAANRKKIEMSSREAKYRLLVDHCSDLIWNLSPEGIFLDLSLSWARVTGYEPSSLIGTSFAPLVHPDDVPTCFQYLRKMNNSKEILQSPEYRVKHADGTLHWHIATSTPVVGQDGEYVSMVGVSRDITERKQAEEKLRKSEQQFRFLAENTTDVVWQQDANMRFTYVNDAGMRLSGYSRGEIIGHSSLDLFTPEGRKIIDVIFARRREMEKQGKQHETIIFEAPQIRKDGSIFWSEVTTTPLYNEAGKIVGFNGTTRNIDKRKRTEAERELLIRELQAALDRVNQLEGILPICASCKKIRDDAGNWQQIELYISDHSKADFSHGICPECMHKLYPGVGE